MARTPKTKTPAPDAEVAVTLTPSPELAEALAGADADTGPEPYVEKLTKRLVTRRGTADGSANRITPAQRRANSKALAAAEALAATAPAPAEEPDFTTPGITPDEVMDLLQQDAAPAATPGEPTEAPAGMRKCAGLPTKGVAVHFTPPSEFTKDKKNADGLSRVCKACNAEYARLKKLAATPQEVAPAAA